jgi:hypothetical protein
MGYELRSVKWLPNGSCDKDSASSSTPIPQRLSRHELFHHLLSRLAKKYEKMVNVQGSLIRSLLAELLDEAYQEEEEFVADRLVDALERMDGEKRRRAKER